MRIERLPGTSSALVFDLDSTLYTHPAYAAFQNSALVERLARERGESPEAVFAELQRLRAERRAAGQMDTSYGQLFLALGVPIRTSVRWREELFRPADWLAPDPQLDAALAILAERYRLALVTNNPRSVGLASLEALGVRRRFEVVVGLDDTERSKPDPAPFLRALELLDLPAHSCVSIGDRWEVDLIPALALGMGAVLVEAVWEVYGLPSIL